MKKISLIILPLIIIGGILLLSGCTTLAVKAPPGMFVSTGDYVKGVKTLGIIQEKTTVVAPLFLVDINNVHQQLYEKLIDKARAAGANGVTNIKFEWVISPFTYATIYLLTAVVDFYIEGVAIKAR